MLAATEIRAVHRRCNSGNISERGRLPSLTSTCSIHTGGKFSHGTAYQVLPGVSREKRFHREEQDLAAFRLSGGEFSQGGCLVPNAYLTTQQVVYLQHCGMLRGSPFSLNANKSKLTLKGQSNEILDPHFFS